MRIPRSRRNDERGAVLIIVMMVMLGLLGLGMTALWLTSGNLQVASNINQRQQALYVAEAGIERARELLNGPIAPVLSGPGSANLLNANAHALDNVPTAIDANGRPNGFGAVLRDPGGNALANIDYPTVPGGSPISRTTGSADAPRAAVMGRYTVWIRNDAAELRQGLYTADNNLAVIVRSRGVAMDGRTNVVLEVTLGPSPMTPGTPGNPQLPPPVLCNSGKNACDDNNSTQYGVVVN